MLDTEPHAPLLQPPTPRGAVPALRALLLGGLTAMEVLALVVAFVTVVGLLWMTGTVAPESLVTSPWLRAGWALSVVAVLRPVTWIPYATAFLGLRAVLRAALPRVRPAVRNASAHAGTVALLAAVAALLLASVRGAARWAAGAAGFVMGTVDVAGLGHATGRWDALRIGAGAAVVLLLRPVVPPLGPGLDLRARPMLWFVEGRRGRVDAWLLGASCGAGLLAGAAGALRSLG